MATVLAVDIETRAINATAASQMMNFFKRRSLFFSKSFDISQRSISNRLVHEHFQIRSISCPPLSHSSLEKFKENLVCTLMGINERSNKQSLLWKLQILSPKYVTIKYKSYG